MSDNFFNTIGGRRFQDLLLNSLRKIGNELERSNDLKQRELDLKEKELEKDSQES